MALASGRNASQYFISLKRREKHSLLSTKCWKRKHIYLPSSGGKLVSTGQSKNICASYYPFTLLHNASKNTSNKYTNLLTATELLPHIEHNAIEYSYTEFVCKLSLLFLPLRLPLFFFF